MLVSLSPKIISYFISIIKIILYILGEGEQQPILSGILTASLVLI